MAGTGLYLRAVTDRLTIPQQWPDVRAEIDTHADTAALHARLHELDPLAASRMTPTNRRRIVRALEVTIGSGRPFSSFGDGLDAYAPVPFRFVGIDIEGDDLKARIAARLDDMLEAGFLDEVRSLKEELSPTARQALGYKELLAISRGAVARRRGVTIRQRTSRLARRQLAWFRRDPRIEWRKTGRSRGRGAGRLGVMPEAVYAGLGNTFAIVFGAPVDEDAAREICARLDIDGVITAEPATDGADLTMVLRNADGSRAEVSGNGLACLAAAAVAEGQVESRTVTIATDAGVRRVRIGHAPPSTWGAGDKEATAARCMSMLATPSSCSQLAMWPRWGSSISTSTSR